MFGQMTAAQRLRKAFLQIAFLLFASATSAQDVQGNIQQRNDLKVISERLSKIEETISRNSSETGLSPDQIKYREDLNNLKVSLELFQNQARDTALSLSAANLTLGGQYFQIFLAVVAMAGAVGALAAYIIQKNVTNVVLKKASIYARQQVDQKVRTRGYLLQAEGFAVQSFTWWEYYHPRFQLFLSDKQIPPDLERDIRVALTLADRGLTVFAYSGTEDERLKDENAWFTYTKLINHWVYNKTAQLLLMKEEGKAYGSDVHVLLERADECLKLSTNKRAATFWYGLHDTVGFAMMHFGSDATQTKGRKLIQKLFAGEAPDGFDKPPTPFLLERRAFYFPARDNGSERDDPYGLACIPEPK